MNYAFLISECVDLLQNVMDISIPSEDVAALERRTEGWIAGLQLAAVSMQHQDRPQQLYKSIHRQ